MKRTFVLFLLAILILISGLFIFSNLFHKKETAIEDKAVQANLAKSENNEITPSPSPELKIENNKVLIYAAGDIMLDRGVKYMVYKYGNGDYKFPFEKSADYLKRADIIFGNLESQISDKGNKIGTINSFRAEPKAIDGLKLAGFNIVSVANNHSFDYNTAALKDSFNNLKEAGISYIGGGLNKEEAYGVKIIEKNGVRVGFMAFCSVGAKGWAATDNMAGIAFIIDNDMAEIKDEIKKAKEKVDILIVSSHSGEEYQVEQNKAQESMYQKFIDAGADIVLGHHPHVIQPVEQYANGWIAYSLGNFIFDMGFSENTMKGELLEISIEDKKIKNVLSKEFKINSHFQPELNDFD